MSVTLSRRLSATSLVMVVACIFWSGRMAHATYRFAGKRRTLALGVYPTTTLSVARACREDARVLLAQGADPSEAKKPKRRAALHASETTFEVIAREWLHNQRKRLAPRYCEQILARLERDVFPEIGSRPIAEIDAPELLGAIRKIEQRGVLETARRLRQSCGQIFRYAIVTGRAKHDPSADLRGALGMPRRKRGHKAMSRDELPNFLRALEAYDGAANPDRTAADHPDVRPYRRAARGSMV